MFYAHANNGAKRAGTASAVCLVVVVFYEWLTEGSMQNTSFCQIFRVILRVFIIP